MLTYNQALKLAETWCHVLCGDGVEIVINKVIKKPYGWIFFYQNSTFLTSDDYQHALIGNAPIIIDRINGEIRVTGTSKSLSEYLTDYEATIPKARLDLSLPNEP
ncbi:hypothetical protein Q674_14700 [Acinetobacter sp. COS3]|uniref:YrhB domain-containing protein n=1 Tax=Acinetobacter sp. COS3 TaxID=1397525 RepID=UPI0003B7EE4C|nr:hypothetical protein Q674_14700 [Acinetobacter sp. COS3]